MTQDELDVWLLEEYGIWFLGAKLVGDRYAVMVSQIAHVAIKIGRTERRDKVDDIYSYERVDIAIMALHDWEDKDELTGWIRHQPSNRRRPDGDPAKEYIAP